MVTRRKFLAWTASVPAAIAVTAVLPRERDAVGSQAVKTTTTTAPPTTTTTAPPTTTTTAPPLLCSLEDADVVVAAGTYAGFTVPAGETWLLAPGVHVSTANIVVFGMLCARPGTTLLFDGDPLAYVGGGMTPIASDVGLWVQDEGMLDFRGTPRTAWARDAVPADWGALDDVVVAPSGSPSAPNPYTFTSYLGGTIVMPQVGITRHNNQALPTEVLNLTRDLVVGTLEGRAGHILIHSMMPQVLAHVRFSGLGVAASTPNGRYPLHFHMCEDGSRDSVVEGCVAVGSKHHAFVPHRSHGILFDSCVAYDTVEEPFWWDASGGVGDNTTDDVLYQDCVAAKVTSVGSSNQRLSGFRLGAGMRNAAVGCVAVAVLGSPKSRAGFNWPEGDQPPGAPIDSGVWTFTDCVAHNNQQHGIFVWQNDSSDHTITRFIAYHNGDKGIAHGAYFNRYVYDQVEIYGCAVAVLDNALSPLAGGPRPLEFIEPIFDRYGRPNAVGFVLGEHAAPGSDAFLTSPTFVGYGPTATLPATKDISVQLADNPTGGPHRLLVTNPTWSAPAGQRVVWAPGTYIPGCQVQVDATVLTPGTNL
jgi:hypothetical protein